MDGSSSNESRNDVTGRAFVIEHVLFWLGKVKQQSRAGRLQPQRHQKLLDYPKQLLRMDRLLQVWRV
jgi:hypothetical protein